MKPSEKTSKRRVSPKQPKKDAISPASPAGVDIAGVAAGLGVHLLAAKIIVAAGAPSEDSPYLDEPLETAADAGVFFGVSERTIHSWLARGMPGDRGAYFKSRMLGWRKRQPEAEPWHTVSDRSIPAENFHMATGDALRALVRVIRTDLFFAFCDFVEEATSVLGRDKKKLALIQSAFMDAVKPLIANDEEADQIARDVWNLI